MTHSRARAGTLAGLATLLAGCGNMAPDPEPELQVKTGSFAVVADPPGQEFYAKTTVTLSTSLPAQIYYTQNGEPPTEKTGLLYQGPVELTESTLLSFIAVSPQAIWSTPGAELYTRMQTPTPVAEVSRGIKVDPDSVFIGVSPLDRDIPQERTVKIQSFGTAALTVDSVTLGPNPKGRSFWNPDAYKMVVKNAVPAILRPGEAIEVSITYLPTDTFASAAIIIKSDEQLDGGERIVELWGRILTW